MEHDRSQPRLRHTCRRQTGILRDPPGRRALPRLSLRRPRRRAQDRAGHTLPHAIAQLGLPTPPAHGHRSSRRRHDHALVPPGRPADSRHPASAPRPTGRCRQERATGQVPVPQGRGGDDRCPPGSAPPMAVRHERAASGHRGIAQRRRLHLRHDQRPGPRRHRRRADLRPQ